MLIQRAALLGGSTVDIRVGPTISEVATRLVARRGEDVLDAGYATVLPGLHDHHVHLRSAAVALDSVRAGPPQVRSAGEMVEALRAARPGSDGWIRGYGYHESVAGELNRELLDRVSLSVPIRVQHRSGALWVVNSAGLARLGLADHPDGRLLRASGGISPLWPRREVPLTELSRQLAARGVTGVTDATPHHTGDDIAGFARARRDRELLQRLHCMAPADTAEVSEVTLGPTKIILDDAGLDLDGLTNVVRDNHARDRGVAVHCVTAAQLVVTIAAIRAAGAHRGDRIEHAAVVPDDCLADIAELEVTVVTQPNFIAERGDDYLTAVAPSRHHQLWRLKSLQRNGIPVALSTDMPFGDGDPWAAMQAAVHRTTGAGVVLNPTEQVSARAAVTMFTGRADRPGTARGVKAGQPGDLCVLTAPPTDALAALEASLVRATVIAGEVVFDAGC
ncbi:MAG TPA: amidohydrolase family protein [Mycobacterium sp.]|nr:amidohydrolase family protein [Mycobacterium sp.]